MDSFDTFETVKGANLRIMHGNSQEIIVHTRSLCTRDAIIFRKKKDLYMNSIAGSFDIFLTLNIYNSIRVTHSYLPVLH